MVIDGVIIYNDETVKNDKNSCDFSHDIRKDRRYFRYYLHKDDGSSVDMRPANPPKVRIWKGQDTEGNGCNWVPVMTYADFCFLAAEFTLAHQISSSKTSQRWYEDGVRASFDQWNDMGKFCDIANYEPMTEAEIATFLDKPDIKWDASRALEQIYCQAYVEHYKNVDEAYALQRRSGMPNFNTTVIQSEQPYITEVLQDRIPRRVRYTYPNEGVHNYENLKKRIDVMLQEPQFGDIGKEDGRVWWDSK